MAAAVYRDFGQWKATRTHEPWRCSRSETLLSAKATAVLPHNNTAPAHTPRAPTKRPNWEETCARDVRMTGRVQGTAQRGLRRRHSSSKTRRAPLPSGTHTGFKPTTTHLERTCTRPSRKITACYCGPQPRCSATQAQTLHGVLKGHSTRAERNKQEGKRSERLFIQGEKSLAHYLAASIIGSISCFGLPLHSQTPQAQIHGPPYDTRLFGGLRAPELVQFWPPTA